MNLTQKAKEHSSDKTGNTAFIDGARKFITDVKDLEIDLIDQINPLGQAYAILSKIMSEDSLKQVAAVIAAKKISLMDPIPEFRWKVTPGRNRAG